MTAIEKNCADNRESNAETRGESGGPGSLEKSLSGYVERLPSCSGWVYCRRRETGMLHVPWRDISGAPSQAYPIRFFPNRPDLSAYEGKTIRAEGWLSPGDAFRIKKETIPVVESPRCSNDIRKIIRKRFEDMISMKH